MSEESKEILGIEIVGEIYIGSVLVGDSKFSNSQKVL